MANTEYVKVTGNVTGRVYKGKGLYERRFLRRGKAYVVAWKTEDTIAVNASKGDTVEAPKEHFAIISRDEAERIMGS